MLSGVSQDGSEVGQAGGFRGESGFRCCVSSKPGRPDFKAKLRVTGDSSKGQLSPHW